MSASRPAGFGYQGKKLWDSIAGGDIYVLRPDDLNAARTAGASIYPAVQNMLLAARALGLGATLTTLYLNFEKEAEAALGLPPDVHSYALLPIGYPIGRFGPVRRVPLAEVVYEDQWGQPMSGL